MPRSRGAAGTVSGSWSGCSCANCNKKRSVGLRAEDIELLAEDIADLLDQGAWERPGAPQAIPAGVLLREAAAAAGGALVASACMCLVPWLYADIHTCQTHADSAKAAPSAVLPSSVHPHLAIW